MVLLLPEAQLRERGELFCVEPRHEARLLHFTRRTIRRLPVPLLPS